MILYFLGVCAKRSAIKYVNEIPTCSGIEIPTNNKDLSQSDKSSTPSDDKIPYFPSMKLYYKNSLCFVRCKPSACIPKEIENGMYELRTSHAVTVNSNEIVEIALDIMVLSPVKSYAYYSLSLEFAKLGLLLLNSIHLESNTGTVTLIVKNMSTSDICVNKSSIIATMVINPKMSYKYFCIEAFELTRSPHELRKFFEVCKAKEENSLFKI